MNTKQKDYMKKNIHQEAKSLREKMLIALGGHDARIKEQKLAIKNSKKAIKMHKLLKKQAKTGFKLSVLELQ